MAHEKRSGTDTRPLLEKEFFYLLPLLFVYGGLIIAFASRTFQGDEPRYAEFAVRLSHGYYSPPHGDVELWNGPGYPLILFPFALLKLPWLAAKLCNALFLFAAVLYFYHTLKLYINTRQALVFSFLLGLYPPFLREAHLLMTENLEFFLMCGFIFHFCKLQGDGVRKPRFHFLLTSLYLGYLALTKIFFGYVLLAGALLFFSLSLWRSRFRKMCFIYLFGLLWCIPYLLYTYSITGKVFYWGTSGGLSLYWMSSPYKEELGDWISPYEVPNRPELARHREFFNAVSALTEVKRDNAFKRQGMDNIKHHPRKFIVNWAANVGRLLFSYPFSYTQQKLSTYFYILPNIFIVVLFVLSCIPAFLRRKSLPDGIIGLFFFGAIAFGGSTLVSAFDRQFRPLVPLLLLWIAYVYIRVLRVELHPESPVSSGS
ncbi:MAG: hypothetical protein ABSF80_03610 [Chitinispirillaceae bacterium]|jgi:hypothetical protein